MKKIMIMVSAIMMVATASATENNVTPFNSVKVNVPGRVRIIKGDTYSITVSTATQDKDAVKFDVRNGVLHIGTDSQDMLQSNGRGTVITIVTPEEKTDLTTGEDVLVLAQKEQNKK